MLSLFNNALLFVIYAYPEHQEVVGAVYYVLRGFFLLWYCLGETNWHSDMESVSHSECFSSSHRYTIAEWFYIVRLDRMLQDAITLEQSMRTNGVTSHYPCFLCVMLESRLA